MKTIAFALLLAAACNAPLELEPAGDAGADDLVELRELDAAPADLGLELCAYRDGWSCISGTTDCIGPDGARRRIWEAPIFCCNGQLVAPPFSADLSLLCR